MLSKATIEELRQILKEDYGMDASFEESAEIARVLTGYFDLTLRINARRESSVSHETKIAYCDNMNSPNSLKKSL